MIIGLISKIIAGLTDKVASIFIYSRNFWVSNFLCVFYKQETAETSARNKTRATLKKWYFPFAVVPSWSPALHNVRDASRPPPRKSWQSSCYIWLILLLFSWRSAKLCTFHRTRSWLSVQRRKFEVVVTINTSDVDDFQQKKKKLLFSPFGTHLRSPEVLQLHVH